MSLADVTEFLERFAPRRLAEEWDNVGLLVGDPDATVERVMTCLTVTPATAAEAIREQADLIVTHHPLPFRAIKRLTTETTAGRLLWDLIGRQIAVYSPHTAFDSAAGGINRQLAERLKFTDIQPLQPIADDPDELGAGRLGSLATPQRLDELAARLKSELQIDHIKIVGLPELRVERAAVACGSAGSFLGAAHRRGCQVLVTGETTFHTCLEAEALGIGLLLPGHFASERFALDVLAGQLAEQFPQLTIWASRDERDPIRWE